MYVAVQNTSSIHGFLEFIATAGILKFSGPPHVVVACMCCVSGNGIQYSIQEVDGLVKGWIECK